MMTKLLKLRVALASLPLFGSAMAASSVTYDFESSTSGDLFEEGGVSGWSQDTANPTAFDQTIPLAYISTTNFGGGSSNAAHLGTQFANTANNSDTTLTGDLSSVNFANYLTASFSLAILDNSADSFEGRDGFSVALGNAAGQQAATIGFTPTAGVNESWDIRVGTNGSTSPTSLQVLGLSSYNFKIVATEISTSFSFGPGDLSTGNVGILTTAPITSLNTVNSIVFGHDPLADAGTSSHTLAFDDINVQNVPEPSSSLLMVLCAGLMAIRRRR